MGKRRFTALIVAAFLLGAAYPASAQRYQKIAQTGFQFLSVVPDARAAGLANSVNTILMGSASLFANPATMAEMEKTLDLTVSLNRWFADIRHNAVSLAFRPMNGQYGTFGFSALVVDYGEVIGTVVAENEQGYVETGIITPSAMAVGVGYAKQLSDRFSVGGQVKYTRQDLGPSIIPLTDTTTTRVRNRAGVLAFDFGTRYKTGIKSLVFGMSIRNFSEEIKYARYGFQLPLVFTLGISMNILDFVTLPSVIDRFFLSIDATHYRSHPEEMRFGLEYGLLGISRLRVGYVIGSDREKFAFGFGVNKAGFAFDYSYTPFQDFQSVQRLTARFTF